VPQIHFFCSSIASPHSALGFFLLFDFFDGVMTDMHLGMQHESAIVWSA